LILVAGAIAVELAVFFYFLRKEISAWRSGDNLWTALQSRKRWRTYRQRLRSPKPNEVEETLGALLPSRLLALYSDTKTILENNFRVLPETKYSQSESFSIGEFRPLDAQSLQDLGDMSELGSAFCFADDGCGNYFWVSLDKIRQKDTQVWQIYRDVRENIKVADSLEEFLSWPRVPH
jgi:hypothetical protein